MRALIVFTSLWLGACLSPPQSSPPPQVDDINFVEEYGFCFKACYRELGISADGDARIAVRDRRDGNLVLDRSVQLSADEAARLRELADGAVSGTWAPRYGCPDCVDQGAFELAVRDGEVTQHTVLDPMQHPETFDDLVGALRAVLLREIAH